MTSNPPYKHITRYDLVTGRMLGVGIVDYYSAPDDGQGYFDGHHDIAAVWYNGSLIVAREALGASLSSAEITLGQTVTLSPLPIPCEVNVWGTGLVTVNDGTLEITPLSIGEDYKLIVDEPGYLRESFLFDVVDP